LTPRSSISTVEASIWTVLSIFSGKETNLKSKCTLKLSQHTKRENLPIINVLTISDLEDHYLSLEDGSQKATWIVQNDPKVTRETSVLTDMCCSED
jgi:hypothetical protein